MHNVVFLSIRQRKVPPWCRLYRYSCLDSQNVWSSLYRPPFGQANAYVQRRGAKARATIQLDGLPKGPLHPVENLSQDQDVGPAYPAVVLQARNNMQKYANCVLLTRVGSFYEVKFIIIQLLKLYSRTE